MIDVIIISYNSRQLTANCIDSILKSSVSNKINIIVVDNNSKDDTVNYIHNNYEYIMVIANNENLGYAKAVNIGMKNSKSEYVIISNNDIIYFEDTIELLYNFIKTKKNCAVVAPQQFYPNGLWQASYNDFPGLRLGIKYFLLIIPINHLINKYFYKLNSKRKPKCVEYADGAVLCMRRSVFNEIAGFDEDYFFYAEEADFCKRLKNNNHSVFIYPDAKVYHIRGGSDAEMAISFEKQKLLVNSKLLFSKKHNSKNETNAYIFFEKIHHEIMLIAYKISGLISRNKRNDNKINYYTIMNDIWKDVKKL